MEILFIDLTKHERSPLLEGAGLYKPTPFFFVTILCDYNFIKYSIYQKKLLCKI